MSASSFCRSAQSGLRASSWDSFSTTLRSSAISGSLAFVARGLGVALALGGAFSLGVGAASGSLKTGTTGFSLRLKVMGLSLAWLAFFRCPSREERRRATLSVGLGTGSGNRALLSAESGKEIYGPFTDNENVFASTRGVPSLQVKVLQGFDQIGQAVDFAKGVKGPHQSRVHQDNLGFGSTQTLSQHLQFGHDVHHMVQRTHDRL